MTANLILHWYLDALSAASQAIDSTDNHLNGTVAGRPQNRADARFGSALDLNGSTDSVTLADTKLLRLTTYTVEVWMQPRTPLGGVIGKPPGDLRLVLKPDGSVEHHFCTGANADENHATPAGAVAAGTWRHVAITNDGRTAAIYVDGKQVSARPYTGNRTVQNVALQVGQSYPGLLAHLRIYDGALAAAEVQRDMADDEAALAAFVRTHPVDFALLDVDQQPVLFIDDTPAGQPMTLRLTNTSRQDIEVLGSAGPALALHLRTGVLAMPPQPAVGTPGWTLQASTELGTGDTVLALACAATTTIPRGGTYDIRLTGLKADGTGGTRGTRAELAYQGMRYAGEKDQLTGNRIQYLEIVNRRGRKDIPLTAGFVGGNRVLSDGVTASTLRIRLANLSRDTALSLDGAVFTISYVAQAANETREWALSDAGKAGQAVLGALVADKATANWAITPQNLGQRMQWTLRPPAKAAFDPDGSVVLTLSQVFALSSLGQAQIVIGYQNVPGYQDGTLILTAEKSPLMFAGQRTGIGTTAPEAKLQIVDTNQDPNGGTLILGPKSQANLRLGYNADYTWIQSHGSKPLVINGIGDNVAIGATTPAPPAKLTVTADNAHLQLRRTGTAPAGKQMFLELYQDTTTNAVYPFIRFNNAGKFWHRIEARDGGLIFKTGDPNSDALVNIGANIAAVNGLVNASDNLVVVRTGGKHLQILRSGTTPDNVNGNTLYLELFQDNPGASNWPSIRFHQSNKFWHRIEARTEGLLFKTGDLGSDSLVDVYANTFVANTLKIGGITLGRNEMDILQKLAAGNLQFDLLNVYQNEYVYAADYQPYDGDRRRVFTWRTKGQRINQGRWRIISPS